VRGPVLITGGGGFVGTHLIDALAAPGLTIEAWARPGDFPRHDFEAPPGTRWRTVDVLDRHAVAAALGELRPEVIFHCAGAAHVGASWQATRLTLETNVIGTHHVLEADRRLGLGARILVPGSATVYAEADVPVAEDAPLHPDSPYAVSKLAQEQLGRAAAAEGQHVVVTRSFNHIGPRQAPSFAAASFARQIARAEIGAGPTTLRVGNLEPRRDLTDVRDTVQAYIALIARGHPGSVYNVCSGRAVRMRDLVDGLRRRARVVIELEIEPTLFRPHDPPLVAGDAGLIRRHTGWAASIPLEQTIDDLLAYWRANESSASRPSR
jgi:GDP-4-dehydro-6-deoxy-D-mannose reductase